MEARGMETVSQHQEEPILNIIGEKVALGPVRRDCLPLYLKWINDVNVARTLNGDVTPVTLEARQDSYERWSKSDGTSQNFNVYERATLRPIGMTWLLNIDLLHQTAGFGIVIGEKDCWGKGYGTEATTLTLDYAFIGLGLHNVMLTVSPYNERGIRAYTRAGFREFGRRREAWRLGGRAYDVVYMDCLATEFQSPVLHRLLAPPPSSR
jgi:RimJ/RimL family protein N-acetyltransferase